MSDYLIVAFLSAEERDRYVAAGTFGDKDGLFMEPVTEFTDLDLSMAEPAEIKLWFDRKEQRPHPEVEFPFIRRPFSVKGLTENDTRRMLRNLFYRLADS